MNVRFVVNQLGLLMLVLAAVMLGVAGWGVYDWGVGIEPNLSSATAMLISVGVGAVVGGAMWLIGMRARNDRFGRREALLLVSLSWFAGAALAALPFYLWAHHQYDAASMHPFRDYIGCYFEAMSGLTTTGATVLGDHGHAISDLPGGLLLWRATTHWLGGLGIVVLFVAVLPMLGVGGKKLFSIEAPGPKAAGVRPRIRDTARVLWFIYLGLTVAQTVALRLCGMGWQEALSHTFATLATGGFSTKDASIAAYGPTVIYVIIAFMFLAGINFGLYYRIIQGSIRSVWQDTEFRAYTAFTVIGAAIVIASVYFAGQPIPMANGEPLEPDAFNAVTQGVFTTVSIQTTTGFCTADFNQWPFIAKAVLIVAMFIGGSAGSTGGGLKVIRIWVALKVIAAELEHVFHPNVVRPLRIGGAAIDPDLRLSVVAYVLGVVMLFAVGSIVIMALETGEPRCDIITAATASIACLFNIGPGLANVGAVENYGWFNNATKLMMCLWMVIGRLEVFAIAVLFYPRFWRSE